MTYIDILENKIVQIPNSSNRTFISCYLSYVHSLGLLFKYTKDFFIAKYLEWLYLRPVIKKNAGKI
ncbi:hypothetical protein A8C56_08705 [Niabella ginsenosidivorans]|uniref:Uncharacterized protein n=1 Tax=Niabella ginsenosidivorans TaxID=1176587 RepID=A0A1A9I075_9BACT|nr:hypothetical protein A8C56_08705 [Niabella ginsenosidivorans]